MESDLPLTPGMSAAGLLEAADRRRAVVVSRDALLRHPDGRITVWVVEGEAPTATVRERRVEIGLAFDGRVAIRSGLEAGTRVVVEGNEALQQGQQVSIRGRRADVRTPHQSRHPDDRRGARSSACSGVMAALRIPVQMIPDLEVRTITVRTSWPGATPQDIEKEILIEQEEYLRNIPSLQAHDRHRVLRPRPASSWSFRTASTSTRR